MKKFSKFLTEGKDQGAVFTFGRFNPPTVGHGKLVDKLLRATSGGYKPVIYTSHTEDPRKNPLKYKDKIKWLRKFFKKVTVVDTTARTIFDIVTDLYDKGFNHIRMVVGSDRVGEFDKLIKTYNGKYGRHGHYDFEKIEVVSAGERDPDADDVSGMSASKMRMFADKGDFDEFSKGVPSNNKRDAEGLWKDVRKGMGIREETIPDYIYEDLITEGVYDAGIFKAVFLMGGPGSGKTAVVKALALKALGLKLINTDSAFESELKKAGHSLDLRTMDADIRDPIRKKAKRMTGKGLDMYIQGRLGLIFDTTSAKASKIKAYKRSLDYLGYESKMIYVRTSLANAQARNAERARKLPEKIVQKDWENAQKNATYFRGMFGVDFVEILNDDTYPALKKKASQLYGRMLGWTTQFPNNKSALIWKQRELLMKKHK
jgi:predicted kinase/DNA-binding ferritin-like protein (Dps family)